MLEKIRIMFSISELRKKILLTLGLLAVYRLGWNIMLPMINSSAMQALVGGSNFGELLDRVAVFSGTQLDQMTIFGLGIMPYISASIIFQLLATVWEPLEKLQKEGESGRKKINEYTRYHRDLHPSELSLYRDAQRAVARGSADLLRKLRQRGRRAEVLLALYGGPHHDDGNGVFDVARGANR